MADKRILFGSLIKDVENPNNYQYMRFEAFDENEILNPLDVFVDRMKGKIVMIDDRSFFVLEGEVAVYAFAGQYYQITLDKEFEKIAKEDVDFLFRV